MYLRVNSRMYISLATCTFFFYHFRHGVTVYLESRCWRGTIQEDSETRQEKEVHRTRTSRSRTRSRSHDTGSQDQTSTTSTTSTKCKEDLFDILSTCQQFGGIVE